MQTDFGRRCAQPSEFRDRAIADIIASDPVAAAGRVLRLIMLHTGAASCALYRVEGSRLALFAAPAVTQFDLDRARDAWEDGSLSILAGNPWTEDRWALEPLLPVPPAATAPAGVVYLALSAPGRLNLDLVDTVAPLLQDALLGPASGHVRGYEDGGTVATVDVLTTSKLAFERQRLLVLLERHEWNIARVARALQVQRSTIYRRLERFAVERQRVRVGAAAAS